MSVMHRIRLTISSYATSFDPISRESITIDFVFTTTMVDVEFVTMKLV